MSDTTTFIIKQAIESWNTQLRQFNRVLNELTDESLMKQISPNRNRGIYILGHMIAVHDRMMPLLGFGEVKYPQLDGQFLKNADDPNAEFPSISELRKCWKDVNETLAGHYNTLSSEEWLQKHNAVSAEDFAKEPHRNRLNILFSRTNHLSSHYGQIVFLKNKKED